MRTEQEITDLAKEAKTGILQILPDLKISIENNDWEDVINYCNGIVVGACSINISEGILGTQL